DEVLAAVCDEQAALGIHGQGVRLVELAGTITQSAPFLDEFTIAVEFQDAGSRTRSTGVAFADEDVAVGGNEDVVGLEQVAGCACAARFTDGHQMLAGRAELVDL